MATAEHLDHDEQRLAELGYVQRLNRGWSSFQNFAISFTIISIFAGTFTTYGQAWNYGGPIAISIGWPVICGLILLVAFSMSELASKYPTAGGLYYWASDLGGRTWGWFTGWFNFIGLVGIVASVVYASATFMAAVFSLYKVNIFGMNFADQQHVLPEIFLLFAVILIDPRADQHLLVAACRDAQQHLGLVARDRHRGRHRDSRLRPRSSPVGQVRLHGEVQQLGLPRGRDIGRLLLVLHPDPGLPPDDVHADGLRRLGARVRGDAQRVDRRREGRLARGLLVRPSRLVRAARAHVCGDAT